MTKHHRCDFRKLTSARRQFAISLLLVPNAVGCGSADVSSSDNRGKFEHAYATSAILFGADDSQNSYISILPSLDISEIDPSDAVESAGWSDVFSADGKLYISDGEAPTLTRYSVTGDGQLDEEQAISFLSYGAQFANGGFVTSKKAYLFAQTGVTWSPLEMRVTGTFELPSFGTRAGGLVYSGLKTGRSFVTRGNRAYVATNWANWDTYEVSEDSLIVVLDTEHDQILKTIPAPCPYLDVATIDDAGYVYFSNWTYSVPQTLAYGKKSSCVVRLAPGTDELDESWSLRFADVTGGHEGAALRYLGDGKALFVSYDETRLAGKTEEDYPGQLADLSNWQFWTVDLATQQAAPVAGLDWSSGGYYMSRVAGRSFLLSPSDDYSTTSFYEVLPDGTAPLRFTGKGWSLDLVRVR